MNIYFGKLYAGDIIFRIITVKSILGLSGKYKDSLEIQCSRHLEYQRKLVNLELTELCEFRS